jgi:3-methyladenine DNA glycosylase AlkD
MNIAEKIRKIKQELRLSMNGVASAFMRENGLNYKLNFGVEIPRLQSIASEFQPNHELAQALWKENIRECKILAGMLQPVDSFYPEIAEIWIEGMPTAEIAQLTVMNLFQKLPYASDKAFQWIARRRNVPTLRLPAAGTPFHERRTSERTGGK